MNLGEIGWGGGMEWIWLAQDRGRWRAVVNAVMNLQFFCATKLGNVSSPQCFDFTSFHLVWDCGMPL
jgi:hypothetical protein